MTRLGNTAAGLALLAVFATGSAALADSTQPRPAPPPAAPVSLGVTASGPEAPVPVVPPDAALDSKDAAASRTLQPNANPTALLFFTIMNSGGAGRYGR